MGNRFIKFANDFSFDSQPTQNPTPSPEKREKFARVFCTVCGRIIKYQRVSTRVSVA